MNSVIANKRRAGAETRRAEASRMSENHPGGYLKVDRRPIGKHDPRERMGRAAATAISAGFGHMALIVKSYFQ